MDAGDCRGPCPCPSSLQLWQSLLPSRPNDCLFKALTGTPRGLAGHRKHSPCFSISLAATGVATVILSLVSLFFPCSELTQLIVSFAQSSSSGLDLSHFRRSFSPDSQPFCPVTRSVGRFVTGPERFRYITVGGPGLQTRGALPFSLSP